MLKNLLYKEFKLLVHPAVLLFPLLGTMLLIPSYPYYVPFIYMFISFNFFFVAEKENKDVLFTLLLPVRKADAVKARFCSIIFLQFLQIVVSIPFAVLRYALIKDPAENLAGIEATPGLYGLVLMMYAVFDAVFFVLFYKTGYKVTLPTLLGWLSAAAYCGIMEAVTRLVPWLWDTLNTTSVTKLPGQLAVLAVGIAVFVIIILLAYRKSVKNFEKVDL